MACHHPFTSPKDEDVDKLLTDKVQVKSKAYDIVINGYEAGGGSIRIHRSEVQEKMFEALGFSVIKLKRESIAFLSVKDLPSGEYRLLNKKEVARLYGLMKTSSNETI